MRSSLSTKRAGRRTLLGAVLLLAAVLMGGCSLCGSAENTKQPNKGADQLPRQPVSAAFLQETDVGRKIVAYLVCIDLDCVDKLDAVVETGRDAIAPLIQLLQHGAPSGVPELAEGVSLARVAFALGRLGDVRAVEPLIRLLQNPDPVVRANAAAALGEIGSNAALPHLVPLISDTDPLVREMTASAMGNLGLREALPNLRSAAASEPLPHVRRAIEKAIKDLEKR